MEELQKTELLKKGTEISKEIGKTAGKAADSISKGGEQLSQTTAFKTVTGVSICLKTVLNERLFVHKL